MPIPLLGRCGGSGSGLRGLAERLRAAGGQREGGRRSGGGVPLVRQRSDPCHSAGANHVIRNLLAEDQGMVQDALATLLGMELDMEVVARLSSGERVVEAATALRPDVALLDIEMPGMDGLEAAAQLHRMLPDCKILILTTFDRPGYLQRAVQAGASGFMVKDGPVEALIQAIKDILDGKQVIDPALAAAALGANRDPLSAREHEVLKAAADGSSVAEIAARLFLSKGRVRNYRSSALQKLDARI